MLSCKSNTKDEIASINSYAYTHPISFQPEQYICTKTNTTVIIDGILNDAAWKEAQWTSLFVDIEGSLKAKPNLSTKAKMTWDDSMFYVAAILEEPHIWATLTERDAIMYHDDDFEIFIDPDADGHNYFEFEMNAFNAIWDLYMLYPYFIDDRRNYIMNWNIKGIRTAVHIEGSINNPKDIDQFWSVEIAIPWDTFKDFKKGSGKPKLGEQWRLNFSRVDWPMDIIDNNYVKQKDENNKNLAENNWVWSPTGVVNMHKPETWGYIQFEEGSTKHFIFKDDEKIKWGLWQLYYQVKECKNNSDKNCDLSNMKLPIVDIDNYEFQAKLVNMPLGFYLTADAINNGIWKLDSKGQMLKIED